MRALLLQAWAVAMHAANVLIYVFEAYEHKSVATSFAAVMTIIGYILVVLLLPGVGAVISNDLGSN